MFTKADLSEFSAEIGAMERKMRDIYVRATKRLQDPDARDVFQALAQAEALHDRLVDQLRILLAGKADASDVGKGAAP